MTKLPDLPSALLTLALADLKKAEDDPRYTVYMGDWHRPRGSGVCAVCLAGAVIAKTFGVSPLEDADPWAMTGGYDRRVRTQEKQDLLRKLLALDCFRTGDVGAGIERMLMNGSQGFGHRGVALYSVDRPRFYDDMNRIVRDLKEAGL